MFSVKGYEFIVVAIVLAVLAHSGKAESGCSDADGLSCQESRFMQFVSRSVHNLNGRSTPWQIIPGLEVVRSAEQQVDEEGRSNDVNGGSLVSEVGRYVNNHELKVKFKDLFGSANINSARSFVTNMFSEEAVEEGRKKDKGGSGMLLMMGMMMGKMMTALGLGGLAALAMKALGISSLALLLAAMVGIKKLAEGNNDGGHHVQYVGTHGSEGHYRKRRDVNDSDNLAYRGWVEKQPTN